MTKEEFKNNAEQKLKRAKEVNVAIEFCEISIEEENTLNQLLLNVHDLKFGWDVGQEIISKGYLNNKPFIIYPISDDIGSGVLITTNRIVKFYSENQSYDEYIYDGSLLTQYSISNISGRSNEKSITVAYEQGDTYLSYCETQYNNINSTDQRIITTSDDTYRVYNDLKAKKLIAFNSNVEYDAGYESFNIDKAFLVNEDTSRELARVSTLYASSASYLNGELPAMISLKTKTKKTVKNFILLADNTYVDVDLYLEEGLNASIKTLEEIKLLVSRNGLALEACEQLEAWMMHQNIPNEDVAQVITISVANRKSAVSRSLKTNQNQA